MSSTENVKLGVCNVLFDGVDLGFTKGGVEVEVATSTKEITVDQMGETPIGEVIMGRTVQATVPLAETTLDNLVAVMPGSVLVSDGAKAQGTITFSSAAPVDGDSVTFGGVTYSFKTNPVLLNEMAVPATIGAAAAALAWQWKHLHLIARTSPAASSFSDFSAEGATTAEPGRGDMSGCITGCTA
jgi:hypothetical protein